MFIPSHMLLRNRTHECSWSSERARKLLLHVLQVKGKACASRMCCV